MRPRLLPLSRVRTLILFPLPLLRAQVERGTAKGAVASRLYSEGARLLTLRHALNQMQTPPLVRTAARARAPARRTAAGAIAARGWLPLDVADWGCSARARLAVPPRRPAVQACGPLVRAHFRRTGGALLAELRALLASREASAAAAAAASGSAASGAGASTPAGGSVAGGAEGSAASGASAPAPADRAADGASSAAAAERPEQSQTPNAAACSPPTAPPPSHGFCIALGRLLPSLERALEAAASPHPLLSATTVEHGSAAVSSLG